MLLSSAETGRDGVLPAAPAAAEERPAHHLHRPHLAGSQLRQVGDRRISCFEIHELGLSESESLVSEILNRIQIQIYLFLIGFPNCDLNHDSRFAYSLSTGSAAPASFSIASALMTRTP